jgi:hypothetical protein
MRPYRHVACIVSVQVAFLTQLEAAAMGYVLDLFNRAQVALILWQLRRRGRHLSM